MMWTITRNAAAAMLLTAFLGACGSGHDGSPNSSGSHVAKKALSPADELQRSLVAGFTQVKPGNTPLPVQVKFALQSKPEVAQPLDVTIAIVPTASNLDRVFGKVEGEEGLEMAGSGELEAAERPVENTPIERTIKVLPQKEGIYTLTATVSVDMAGQISTQSYTFPVITGKGIPDLPSAPAAPAPATAKTGAGH